MRIAIIGAGPGGLILARVLHRRGIDAVVYERETSRAARPQGGLLDVHSDTGQVALRAAGLEDGFRRIARPEQHDLRLLAPDGTLLVQTAAGADTSRPEVDRGELRDLLLDALPAPTVAWGHAYEGATARPGGGWRLAFTGGATADCDLLVGADGAFSRVRPLLSDARPAPIGQFSVESTIAAPGPQHLDLLGPGNFWVLSAQRSLAAQRTADGRVRIYVTMRTEPPTSRAGLLELFADWSPRITALIAACADEFVARSISVLPVGLRWEPVAGVTLLGDAAHLMPPVGLGANIAMLDGAELGRVIADPATTLRDYETAMFTRGEAAATESAAVQAMLMAPDVVPRMVQFFSRSPAAAG